MQSIEPWVNLLVQKMLSETDKTFIWMGKGDIRMDELMNRLKDEEINRWIDK